jgi:hypothetical protein
MRPCQQANLRGQRVAFAREVRLVESQQLQRSVLIGGAPLRRVAVIERGRGRVGEA